MTISPIHVVPRWNRSLPLRAEARRLDALPAYLRRDMGLSLDGPTAIARQLAGKA